MRIAINCRMLIPDKLEGIGWFIYETTKRMIRNHPEDTFLLLFDRRPDEKLFNFPNVEKIHAMPQARHPLLFKWWLDYSVPAMLKNKEADVFASFDGFNSTRLKVPTYLVIHDLAWLHYPGFVSGNHLNYYKKNVPRFLASADGLGTVSEFSKEDLVSSYNIDPDKIDVVYNGCRPVFRPLHPREKELVKQEWGIRHPYFIFTGSIHPRKNAVNLIRAYNHFRFRSHLTHSLIFAGRRAWKTDLFDKELENSPFKKQIKVTGYVSDEEMAQLLGASEALIYPSLFEGFGVPLLEAMNAEVPIITSGVSSMPEVVGDAAILIDPKNPQSIGSAMYDLANNENLHSQLVEKGRRQRVKFSWDQTAGMLYQNIVRTAGRVKN